MFKMKSCRAAIFFLAATMVSFDAFTMDEENPQLTYKEQAVSVERSMAILSQVPGQVFIIATGWFSDSCYRWSRFEVSEPSTKVHYVRSYANVAEGLCLMVMVPFRQALAMENLEEGQHTVKFLNDDRVVSELNFTVSTME